jgi:hypothetical protein
MGRVGSNSRGPSYTEQVVVEQPNKSLKRETQAQADTKNSSAINPERRVSKEQRKTGRVG